MRLCLLSFVEVTDAKFLDLMKVVRSGDLVSYCAEEGVRILGEGKFLVSDSFPGNERTKYCLTSKVILSLLTLVHDETS